MPEQLRQVRRKRQQGCERKVQSENEPERLDGSGYPHRAGFVADDRPPHIRCIDRPDNIRNAILDP
jgi:hypothetical protein